MSDYLKRHFEKVIELYQPSVEDRLGISIGEIDLIPRTLENSLKPGLSCEQIDEAMNSKLVNFVVACWKVVEPACAGHTPDGRPYIKYSPSPAMWLMPFPWDWVAVHEMGHLAHSVIVGPDRHTALNKKYGRGFSEQFAIYIADMTLIEAGKFPWHKRFRSALLDYGRKNGNIGQFQRLGTDWKAILGDEANYCAR